MQKRNSEYTTSLLQKKKKNYNLKMFRLYQIINSNINHSNMRGVNWKFEIMFQIPTMAV